MSRVAAVVVVILSLGFLVNASPIVAQALFTDNIRLEERNKNCYGGYCYGGLDLVTLLLQLQQAIEFKLALLDDCINGGDYAGIILDIEGMLLAANGAIRGHKIGLLGLLTGKLLAIAKIWAAIVISVATHCGRWYSHKEFNVFLGFIIKLDIALRLCLLSIANLGGFFGGFIRICGGLFTQAHIALLLEIQFGRCLAALGLAGH